MYNLGMASVFSGKEGKQVINFGDGGLLVQIGIGFDLFNAFEKGDEKLSAEKETE